MTRQSMIAKAMITKVRYASLLLLAVLLVGCGGGAPTTQTPVTSTSQAPAAYNGPPPATADVQAFKINVWDNLQGNDRCGACHKPSQSPRFVRDDDINLAYQEANTVVDLANPGLSRMVEKVRGGHHCWLSDNNACGDTLTRWIAAWASVTQGGGGTQIQLVAPVVKDAGASKAYPADPTAFENTVWPILRANCSRCHTADSAIQQQPFFASSDPAEAYAAAQTKMNLDDPSQSRFVLRLRNEFHNCWAPNGGAVDCAASADVMQNAITTFANGVTATPIDPTFVLSKALTMYDGTVASGGNRYDNNAIAIYQFKTGSGSIAYDTSGVAPAADLTLSTTSKGGYSWVGGWGIQMTGGKAQALTTASKKFTDLISQTGEYSIEAWVAPGNVAQTEARIVSYSGSTTTRNFELGQTVYNYDFFNRTTSSDLNGSPALSTPDNAKVLQATLQHVVVTFDPINGRRVYVNGTFTGTADNAASSIGTTWDNTFAFVLGNEVSGDKPWVGQIKFVAIHNRALTPEQIQQNFEAGVGERYFLLFGVSSIVNVPQAYIVFEVSQYDTYSYLFKDPRFISLDPSVTSTTLQDIPLKGMRIGINGAEATVGQAYSTLDTVITGSQYSNVGGESLSTVGTIIGLQKGPASDEFFLTFDLLGTQQHVHTEPAVPTPATPANVPRPSDVGVRTFDQINTTMSEITGVSVNATSIKSTYAQLKQSLPPSPDFGSFNSANQIAIAQLAIAYCSELVNTNPGFFAGFNFNSNLSTQQDRDFVINPIVNKVLGSNLSSQPDPTQMHDELNTLITNTDPSRAPGLCVSTACGGARTTVVVKAVCAAGLGSAAALIQ